MKVLISATMRGRRPPVQLSLLIFFLAGPLYAQLNWEGQAGGLITPSAYTGSSSSRGLGHPEVAFHYMNAGPVLGEEFQASINVGFLRIGEIGFTRFFNLQGSAQQLGPMFANGFNIAHIKFRIVPENMRQQKFIPRIATGAVV